MSTALQFDLRQLDALAGRLDQLGMIDQGELLDQMGAEIAEQTRERIRNEKQSPDGVPWLDWSEDYAQTRHGDQSRLMGAKNLLDSIQHIVNGGQVEIGSNLDYAAIHQFGGEEVDMPIPAREYLGLSPGNIVDINDVVRAFLTEHLRHIVT